MLTRIDDHPTKRLAELLPGTGPRPTEPSRLPDKLLRHRALTLTLLNRQICTSDYRSRGQPLAPLIL